MALEQEHKKFQYPLDSNSYRILDEIGVGVSAIVYKALCVPLNIVVSIKAIDLDQSRANLDNVRRETNIMSLLSHPNIIHAHCSFTVDRCLWIVMPFMSCGSLQSIISSSFPDGLSEPCIAIVLRETLNALSYLHSQGHVHRDIKAGNILIDSNGSVKLADFSETASVYEHGGSSSSSSSSSSSWRLTDMAGTPYWMAPEVIHSHVGYSFKADIWSFGITALELAHGRPPLSDLPLSKSLLMKITKRFRYSDYEKNEIKNDNIKNKRFSKAFKDMVGLCLEQDPCKRPFADKLLKHCFFKNVKGCDFLVKNVLIGLPSVEDRFKEIKIGSGSSSSFKEEEEEDSEGLDSMCHIVSKQRRISGWNFNEDGFKLVPVFPESLSSRMLSRIEDDIVLKHVRFVGETIIPESDNNSGESDSNQADEIDQIQLKMVSPETTEEVQLQVDSPMETETTNSDVTEIIEEAQVGVGGGGGVVLEGLMALRANLDSQRQQVSYMIDMFGGEMGRDELMAQTIERLKIELEIERKKRFELEMELEFHKIHISGYGID